MQRYTIISTINSVFCVVALVIFADDRSEVAEPARTKVSTAHVSTRVRVMQNGQWCGLEDLRRSAEQIIDRATTNVMWGDLKEVGAWISATDPTNLVTFHFSFGLGKQSFLVSFGKDGRPSQFTE